MIWPWFKLQNQDVEILIMTAPLSDALLHLLGDVLLLGRARILRRRERTHVYTHVCTQAREDSALTKTVSALNASPSVGGGHEQLKSQSSKRILQIESGKLQQVTCSRHMSL